MTVLIGWSVVFLAKPRRGITVLLEDFADGGVLRLDDGIIARIAGGQFADDAEADRMMVAARDERRTRGRTKRGGMELRITQTRLPRRGPSPASG